MVCVQGHKPKRGGWSWAELHSINGSIPWNEWGRTVIEQAERGLLDAPKSSPSTTRCGSPVWRLIWRMCCWFKSAVLCHPAGRLSTLHHNGDLQSVRSLQGPVVVHPEDAGARQEERQGDWLFGVRRKHLRKR